MTIKNKFLKSFIVLASGSLIGQVVTAVSSPVMTRVFSTNDIGTYTYILSIINLFYPVVALRYDYMIVPEKSKKNVYALLKVSFTLLIIFSVLIAFFYFVFNMSEKDIVAISLLLFAMMVSNGFVDIIGNYNNKYGQYKLMSSTYVTRSIVQNTLMIVAGLLHFGVLGLIASQAIGSFAGLTRQSKDVIKERGNIVDAPLKDMIYVVKKYKNQAFLSTPAIFMNSLAYNALNLAISAIFGNSMLGLYSMSYRILGMPVSLISNNLSKVYYEEAAKEYEKNGNFVKSFKKIIIYTIPIAIIMLVILVVCAPAIFAFIFGAKWRTAGVMSQILAPLFASRIVASTLGPSIWITQQQKYDMIFQILLICGLVISIAGGIFAHLGIYGFLLIYSFLNTFVYLYSIYVHYTLSRGQ